METVETKNSVLDQEAISRKLRRMALEVAEQNIDEKALIIAGIEGNGEVVASCLVKQLKEVSSIQTDTITIHLNKKDPMNVSFDPRADLENKAIIIVDD